MHQAKKKVFFFTLICTTSVVQIIVKKIPSFCLTGWLVDQLVGWLVGWLFGWLVGWLVVWLVGWLIGRLVDLLVGLFSGIAWVLQYNTIQYLVMGKEMMLSFLAYLSDHFLS